MLSMKRQAARQNHTPRLRPPEKATKNDAPHRPFAVFARDVHVPCGYF